MLKRFCLTAFLFQSIALNAMTVEVFALNDIHTSHEQTLSVCLMKSLRTQEDILSQSLLGQENLKSDKSQAKALLEENEKALLRLAECYSRAALLGLSKLPAVVIDSQYVVYGTEDHNLAIKQIEKYRRERKCEA